MKRIIRWMRVVLPPTWVVVTIAVLALLLKWLYALPGDDPKLQQDLSRAIFVILCLICGAYGALRVTAFHPLLRPDYCTWLRTTPWTSRQRLPLGPIHLVRQDGVVFALLLLYNNIPPVGSPAIMLLCFIVPYVACLTYCFFRTGAVRLAFGLSFGLGFFAILWRYPLAQVGVAVVLYLAAYFGIRYTLARFPWHEELSDDLYLKDRRSQELDIVQAMFPGPYEWLKSAWPFTMLSTQHHEPRISGENAILTSLLSGWWLAIVLLFPVPSDPQKDLVVLLGGYMIPVLCLPIFRLFAYCTMHRPPISFLGRIFTLRWIIPGFDKVFVAPLCALIVGVNMPFLLGMWPPVAPFAFPISLMAVCLIVFLCGPSWQTWVLTGHHRIVAPFKNRGESGALLWI